MQTKIWNLLQTGFNTLHIRAHTHLLSDGISYLGGHDAEAHAIVLLQGYRDNLRLFPHWLKREMDRKDNLWVKMKPLWNLWETQQMPSGVLPLKHYGGKWDCGVKRGRDEKREGRNEGGIKGNGEDHRGTCGRWNQVKNENHIMATHTHTHTDTLTLTHMAHLSRAGWGERQTQRMRERATKVSHIIFWQRNLHNK